MHSRVNVMSQEQGEHFSFFKPRASSMSDVIDNKPTKCAILMFHRDCQVQLKIALRRCELLGYQPIVINRQINEDDEDSTESIARLNKHISNHKNMDICFALVEANYSYCELVRKTQPNIPLLRYFMKVIKPEFLFVTSATKECLENIKKNEEFKDIIISDPAYTIINEKVNPTQKAYFTRKASLPQNLSTNSSSDVSSFDL